MHPDTSSTSSPARARRNRLNNFNISVAAHEEFMRRSRAASEYSPVNPHSGRSTGRLPAREVFERIVDASWKTASRG